MGDKAELQKTVKEFLENGKLNDEYMEEFLRFNAFTDYKLRMAKYFIEKLKEFEESGKTRTTPRDLIDRATMCWDCTGYMLVGAYDGLLYEIYHILRFDFPENNAKFFENLMRVLARNSDDDIARNIQNALTRAKKDWEGKLYDERNRWAHQRLTDRNISWHKGEKIKFKDAEKEEDLVEKLERYYDGMSGLIDEIYDLLIKKLEE